MKVVHVIPTFPPAHGYGGTNEAAFELSRALQRRGADVLVVTTNLDGDGVLDVPRGRVTEHGGVPVRYCAIDAPRFWNRSSEMARVLDREVADADVVHAHSIFLWPTTAAARSAQRHGVPYLVSPAGSLDPVCLDRTYGAWRESIASRTKKRAWLQSVGRHDLGRASAIHYTTQAEADAARGAIGYLARVPARVIPLGVDVEAAAAAKRPSRGADPRVLFLGRWDPIKGMEPMIEAMGLLAAQGRPFDLVIAGSGSRAYEARIRELVKTCGVADRTSYPGFVKGASKWETFAAADLFVLPSHHENFGLAVVEALAAGTPVAISSAVMIEREIVQAGAGATIPLPPVAMASRIGALLDDRDALEAMGARGAKLVRDRYTWDAVARQMLETYEDLRR